MNNLFQQRKALFLVLLFIVIAAIAGFYYFFFQPAYQDLQLKESEARILDNNVSILEIEVDKKEKEEEERDMQEREELAPRLPLSPAVDSLILALENIGSISNSSINSISFGYGGSVPERQMEEPEVTEEEENEETDAIDLDAKPENLQVITVNLNVTSPSYANFQRFLQAVEQQERMMFVHNLMFQETDDTNAGISANASISTFYYQE